MSSNQIPQLPIDILINILIRLPAKPLLRFKSVCRTWQHLISGPDFTKLHLDRSLATNSNLRSIFSKRTLVMADFDTFDNPTELDHPFKQLGDGYAIIIGYSNGLLCVSNGDHFNYTVAIYNPTTRTHRMLPPFVGPTNGSHPRPDRALGFGLVDDDYKFVSIAKVSDGATGLYSEVRVYSMRDDSWSKVLDHVPYDICDVKRIDGVFFNGCLHWVIQSKGGHPPNPILGFNVRTNAFFDIPVPKVDMELCYVDMFVGELDGCLCAVLNYMYYSEIWVMKEYGVVESWTRLYEIDRSKEFIPMEKPIGYTLNRKGLYVRIGRFRTQLLDLETMMMGDTEGFGGSSRTIGGCICVENLLMLDILSEVPEDVGTSKGRKKSRKKKMRN